MAMHIVRERPDWRRQMWVDAPLHLRVDGVEVPVVAFGLGGIRIAENSGLGIAHAPIELDVTLPFQGFGITFRASGEIDPADAGSGLTTIRFTDLGERERELLEHFVGELVRGSMAPVADTIQRIDVPVLPLSVASFDAGRAAPKRVRRVWRTAAMSVLYLAIGGALLGYLALTAYRNLFWQEVANAAVSGNVVSLSARGTGQLVLADLRPGATVKAGDVLAEVTDVVLERDIVLAEIAGFERESKLDVLRTRLANEQERMGGARTIERQTTQRLTIEKRSLESQLAVAERQVRQQRAAPVPTQARDVGDATRLIANLQKQIEIKALEIGTRAQIATTQGERISLVGQTTTGAKTELEAQLKLAEVEVEMAERRLAVHHAERKAMTVVAPVDGRLLALPHRDRTGVDRGDVLAVIEAAAMPEVTAYLKPEEALHVGLGDAALVSVPAQRKVFKARVVGVDRPGHMVSESQRWTGTGHRPTDDRIVRLVLRFDWASGAPSPERLPLGMPAVVTLERPDRQRLRQQIDHGLGGLSTGVRDTYRYFREGLVQSMIDGAASDRSRDVAWR